MVYNEILRLKEMLERKNIKFYFETVHDGYRMAYLGADDVCICSIIEHWGSYGSDEDLLEIMGLLTGDELLLDEVLGHLTAEEVFERVMKHEREQV